ncbi:MAG: ankyrin repeat protein [Limisphaerales bacterium]
MPVWLSIQKGDVETLKTQLDAGLDVNTRHSNGYPMLHYATDRSQLEVAKLLLDHGADINLKTTRFPSLTPLDLAWKKRNDEFIDLLIKRGARLPGLHEAAKQNDVELVQLHIDNNKNLNEKIRGKGVPVGIAASEGHFDLVRLFLDAGVSPDALGRKFIKKVGRANLYRSMPLVQMFIMDSDIDWVKTLIEEYHADIEFAYLRKTPLGAAASWGDIEIANYLLGKGANIEGSVGGASPLTFAALNGEIEMAKLLVGLGADVESIGEIPFVGFPMTPLRAAISWGNVELVQLFINEGADIEPNTGGSSALQLATARGRYEIAALLVQLGANVHKQNGSGKTLMMLVIANTESEIVKVRVGNRPVNKRIYTLLPDQLKILKLLL